MIIGDIPQPKIILEGTHLTRKTDLAFALAEHREIIGERRRRWHIPLLSSEWETKSDKQPTKKEPGRSMIDFLPSEVSWAMECYETYVRLLELNCDYYWIVDRFHISTLAHQMLVNGWDVDLGWVDRRLAALGFVLVFCYRDPATFEEARAHRLTYSENPHRYNDLNQFVEEQRHMASLVDRSMLTSLTVDVSRGNVQEIADDILTWIRGIGAFWRPSERPYGDSLSRGKRIPQAAVTSEKPGFRMREERLGNDPS